MTWNVEVRNANDPPHLNGMVKLLLTDTPARPADEIQQELEHWVPLMNPNGKMIICRGSDAITLPFSNVTYYGHEVYGENPAKFTRAMILLTTKENDLVVDPYCGWSTTGQVAVELGRKYYGTDISAVAVLRSRERLDRLIKEVA